MIVIDPDCCDKLHARLNAGRAWDDLLGPLRISDRRVRRDPSVLQRELARAILRRDAARSDETSPIVPTFAPPGLHPVAAAILGHYGIDPVALAIVTEATGSSIDLSDDDGTLLGFWSKAGEDDAVLSVHLSAKAVWEHVGREHTVEMFERMPDTLVVGLGGVALARVVSHPALDPLALTIIGAEIYDKNGSTILNLAPLGTKADEQGKQTCIHHA